jgi:hypothetical protein
MVFESMKNRIHRVQLKAIFQAADRSEAALNRCALTING